MANINRKNYNAAGKSGFENSPAKVWHVNELVGTTIGYKSIAGFINFLANNTETITVVSNDTGFPDANVTITKIMSSRSRLLLTFNLPGNEYRYTSCIGNLNMPDSNNTFIDKISISKDISSTVEVVTFFINVIRVDATTVTNIGYSGAQPQVIYFEFKVFI
jgi:hypothetical protein